jgi:hypothetical protein
MDAHNARLLGSKKTMLMIGNNDGRVCAIKLPDALERQLK